MILIIDLATKHIEINSGYNLGELVKQLAEMFPDGAWKEYTISGKSFDTSLWKASMPIYAAPLSSPTINPVVGPGVYISPPFTNPY
jgi:hypothetical protein